MQEPGSSPRPEVFEVADGLHSAAIHLLRRVRKQDVATGEGPARLSALSVLVFGGPKALGELAAAEQVKPPTMSRMVAGLARSRLVTISADPPMVQAAFRAGLWAHWTFLSDEQRTVIKQINILDEMEGEYAYRAQPYTFLPACLAQEILRCKGR